MGNIPALNILLRYNTADFIILSSIQADRHVFKKRHIHHQAAANISHIPLHLQGKETLLFS